MWFFWFIQLIIDAMITQTLKSISCHIFLMVRLRKWALLHGLPVATCVVKIWKSKFQTSAMTWVHTVVFLQNVGTHLPDYIVSKLKRSQYESSQPQKPRILWHIIFQSSVDILWYQFFWHNQEINAYLWLYRGLLYVLQLNYWYNWTI